MQLVLRHCQARPGCNGRPRPRSVASAAATPAPIAFSPPAELDTAWRSSQQQWLRAAIDDPITVAGAAVHLLGTCHHVPCNPSLVAAAAQAIGPDCIAVEASATRLGVMSKAAKDPGMQQVLARLCAFPLDQCSLVSHVSGKELAVWHAAINAALTSSFCLPLGASEDVAHYALGHPRYSEEVTAAFLAASSGLPLLAVDLPVGHELNERAQAYSYEGPEYADLGLRALEQGQDAVGASHSGLREGFERWGHELSAHPQARHAGGGDELNGFVRDVLVASCLTPSQMEVYDSLDQAVNPRAHEVVVQARDKYMAGRLRQVAEAKGLARLMQLGPGAGMQPPQRVLVVLGRSHMHGVRKQLEGRS